MFCKDNSIDIGAESKARRIKSIPSRFRDVVISFTMGHREHDNSEEHYRTNLFYPLLDSILAELKDRFSEKCIDALNGINALSPASDSFLETESIRRFSSHFKADFSLLCNEVQVLRPTMNGEKPENIVDLFVKLSDYKQAFPTMMFLLSVALTIPVSSTTCESTFSKMKLIKTKTRNSMSDSRLSDLCVLGIEREFEIDFDKVIDRFSEKHRNCRILLK